MDELNKNELKSVLITELNEKLSLISQIFVQNGLDKNPELTDYSPPKTESGISENLLFQPSNE